MPVVRPSPVRRVAGGLAVAAVGPLLLTGCGSLAPTLSPRAGGELVLAATLNERQQLLLVAAATGEVTPLTQPQLADGVPVWSPDGSSVAFVRFSEGGSSAIHVVRADGQNDHSLTSGGDTSDILPTWSPDGHRIAFARVTGNGGQASDAAICVINADGTGLTQLVHGPELPNDPVWAPDGSLIAYDAGSGDRRALFVIGPNGQGLRVLTPAMSGLQLNVPLVWSPDSSGLAFAAMAPNGKHHLFVVDLAGGLEDLSNGPGDDGPPAWSPDGTQLAFWRDLDGNGDIYAISRQSGQLRQLTTESHLTGITTLAWSTDGTELIVWNSPADTGVSRNYLVSATGGALRPLIPQSAGEFMALWRP